MTSAASSAARRWMNKADAVFNGALTFEHAFNQNTKLLAAATVQSGKENTLTTASVSLQVKMTNRLALGGRLPAHRQQSAPAGLGADGHADDAEPGLRAEEREARAGVSASRA